MPDEGDGEDVRVQEAGEEARQEAEGREHGPLGEAHPPEDQLKVSSHCGTFSKQSKQDTCNAYIVEQIDNHGSCASRDH